VLSGTGVVENNGFDIETLQLRTDPEIQVLSGLRTPFFVQWQVIFVSDDRSFVPLNRTPEPEQIFKFFEDSFMT
jgi:hypothetical protein